VSGERDDGLALQVVSMLLEEEKYKKVVCCHFYFVILQQNYKNNLKWRRNVSVFAV
jgi:hypothetical protein